MTIHGGNKIRRGYTWLIVPHFAPKRNNPASHVFVTKIIFSVKLPPQHHSASQLHQSCLLDRTVPHRTATSRTRLPSPSEQHAYRQVTNVGEQEQGHRPLLRVSYCSDHGVLYHASVHSDPPEDHGARLGSGPEGLQSLPGSGPDENQLGVIPEHLNGCCCGYLSGATYERAAGWNVAPVVSVLVSSV